jgi:hypothetical protein
VAKQIGNAISPLLGRIFDAADTQATRIVQFMRRANGESLIGELRVFFAGVI